MTAQQTPERHLAMLIDGDNAQYRLLEQMIETASQYGKVTIRRAYGDWSQPTLANWFDIMPQYGIQSIHQPTYTFGKNATDMALSVDAMDLLHDKTVQGFCIISSDSDYTPLCTRIREKGLFVMGIGKKQTPQPFVEACDVFVHVEDLEPEQSQPQATIEPEKSAVAYTAILSLLQRAFDMAPQDDGWVHLNTLQTTLQRLKPNFDINVYGYVDLPELVHSLPQLATGKTGDSLYVRMKPGVPRLEIANEAQLMGLLHRAFVKTSTADGWVLLPQLGEALLTLDPDYKKTYGYERLSLLVNDFPRQLTTKTEEKSTYIRPKSKDTFLLNLLHHAFANTPQDTEGWVLVGQLGATLLKLDPDYKKTYGHTKPSKLLKSLSKHIEVKQHEKQANTIRLKKR